jgi:hypothetical protein
MSTEMLARGSVMVLLVLAACGRGFAAEVEGKALRETLEGNVGAALASYRAWDAANRDGIGLSDRTTSGGLGWGESSFLRSYMLCYQVTRDTYWLDKVIDHFDRMIGNLSDPDGDGFLAWSDTDYSVALVDAQPAGDVGGLAIEPAHQKPYVKRGGELVTGHEYGIEFAAADSLRVVDVTDGKDLATLAYADPMVIEAIPGAKLTITGAGKAGAAFRVSTHAPEPCEYQVHDGMVTYPVAQFIEVAFTDGKLPAKYRAKAEEYAQLLYRHFYQKWESTWVDLPDGAGLYKFSKNATQRFPDYSLPHNQYLALARTWLVLQDVPRLEHRDEYRDHAERMGQYFKQNLKLNGEAYVWNYWDPLPTEEGVGRHIEDDSHATIDIGFAVEAAARGLVFTEEDLRRFAATYTQVMWNGSIDDPRIGDRVDTNKGESRTWSEWILLGRASETVCDLAAALYVAQGRPVGMAPQMASLYDAVVGVSEADRKAYTEACAAIEEALTGTGLLNPGFEVGAPGVGPLGWTLATWTPDEGGKAEWADEAHQGKKGIALIGGGEQVNVVAQAARSLPGKAGQTVTIAAWYKTTEAARPNFSLIGRDAKGERAQYDNSPELPASADWKQGTWTMQLAEGVTEFSVLLRNHGRGIVFYDDVAVGVE